MENTLVSTWPTMIHISSAMRKVTNTRVLKATTSYPAYRTMLTTKLVSFGLGGVTKRVDELKTY